MNHLYIYKARESTVCENGSSYLSSCVHTWTGNISTYIHRYAYIYASQRV